MHTVGRILSGISATTDRSLPLGRSRVESPFWQQVVAAIPEFNQRVESLGANFLEESDYFIVAALYEFAASACSSGDFDIVRRIAEVVEAGLTSTHPSRVDAFSIDFIEALFMDRNKPHYECIRRALKPMSISDLDAKVAWFAEFSVRGHVADANGNDTIEG